MGYRQPATYKDIQRLTGLSLATISKYYNGRNVLDVNREAIERAALQLDYRVNPYARSLRRGESHTIGVLLPSLQNGFHLSVVVEIEKYFRRQGIGVLVTSYDGEPTAPSRQAVELLLSRRVDGIIGVPSPSDTSILAEAMSAGTPVVTVDWWIPSLYADSVSLDNVAAGRLAARHLLDHGHEDIAILTGPESVSTMQERYEGFRDAVALSGYRLSEDRVVRSPLTVQDGYDGMGSVLASGNRPSAVFTANHELTVGALIALNDSGLRLARDISVIGLDAAEVAQTTRPKLTVIVQPVREIATEAARIMAMRLSEPSSKGEPSVVRLPGRLIVGASVLSRHE